MDIIHSQMKKLFFILILPLIIFSCDPASRVNADFDGFNFCPDGYTAITRGCEPDSPADRIDISVEEFNRLIGLLENSTEDCINVTINPLDESNPIESTLRNYPQPTLELCEVGW
jgi:hypothetical protein